MGKFSLSHLIMCVSKYQKLNSEDYIRLGLCLPDCQDCASGQGHYVKNDKTVSLILLIRAMRVFTEQLADISHCSSPHFLRQSGDWVTGVISSNPHTSYNNPKLDILTSQTDGLEHQEKVLSSNSDVEIIRNFS